MRKKKEKLLGIKELSYDYAISVHKARKALQAFKIMNIDGTPYRQEYAIAGALRDGTPWYRWSKTLAEEAFLQFGIEKASKLDLFSHVKNGSQATIKLRTAVIEIGDICGLSELENPIDDDLLNAIELYTINFNAGFECDSWKSLLHGIKTPSECASYIVKTNRVIDAYVETCKFLCITDEDVGKVEFYNLAIRKILAWIQLQYFR